MKLAAILLLIASIFTGAAFGRPQADPGGGEDAAEPQSSPSPPTPGFEEDAADTVTIARALDKVTARITELELPEDEAVTFGSLEIVSRHCYARPLEETPETFAFLEIFEIRDGEEQEVFSGWMIASSPALHALEHPVYDVWIIGCRSTESGAEGNSG